MKRKKPIKKQGVMQKRKQREYRMLTCGLVMALSVPFVSIGFQGQSYITAKAFSTPKLATMSGSYGIFFNKTYEDKLKEAQQKKEELDQKKKDTEKKLADLEKNKNDILNYIEQLDIQLNELTTHLEELETSISDTKSELEKTRADLKVAKETEAKQYETMKKRIQYLYENGSENVLDVFLSSGSIVEFLNQVEYSQKITEYDDNLLKRYTETKEEIIRQETYQQAKLEELEALEASALYEQETLLALSAEKGKEIIRYTEAIGANEELFAEYSNEIANQEKNISDIKEEERKRIEEEARKAKEEEERRKREAEEKRKQEQANQSSDASSVEKTDNKDLSEMIWPLPGDPNIYSRFGYRNAPTAGASTYHRGVDIGGAMGANIVASLAGRVVAASYSLSSGNYITIDHGNGVQTRYLHCSKLLVGVGDTVMQGQVIAKVGSTGISTGPHLHFSLVLNGTYVDPLKYISYN
ncbi:murein hydrolase activator EnvC family protein [Lachnoclostridium sp.]|nr:peptidoglycan DD-metalloendopeptidase family protein [Lachnoclostridium sp.]